MSSLALTALGIAHRSTLGEAALFTEFAERTVPSQIARIESLGHTVEGEGVATYIADALCDEALLAAHPRFVVRARNGRIFRLLPLGNSLSVEQGGARGDVSYNDQPAIQAAIDYAQAVGAGEVRFEQATYRLDCPERTSHSYDKHAPDGHPLVVRSSLALRGVAGTRTVLDFRAAGGADPERNWQTVDTDANDATPAVWRGGGILLLGDITDPAPAPRTIGRIELDRLILRGNRKHTGTYVFPADPATGDGWDISDKALWVQDCFVGDIVCRDVDMVGWKGEIFYLAGEAKAVERVELERCVFATSNASALNPSVDAEIHARDCRFGDCFQAHEDVAKTRAHYDTCTWFDCDHMGLGSGPTAGVLHNFKWPTREAASPVPQTLLTNCEFRDIRSLTFASWVRGTIRTIDTTVTIDGNEAMALRDTDLAIEAWLDRKSGIHALALGGVTTLEEAVPGAPPGTFKQPPSQVRLRVAHHRTRLAQDRGSEWLGCYWTGYLARSCALHVEGDVANGRLPNGGTDPISMPRITYRRGEAGSPSWAKGWYRLPDIAASGRIAPAAPMMTVAAAGDIVADLTLARTPAGGADFGYADGQRIKFVKQGMVGTLRFVKGADDGTAVLSTRVLANAYDWIAFTYNRDWQRWEESGFLTGA